jgi:hypothetical protein
MYVSGPSLQRLRWNPMSAFGVLRKWRERTGNGAFDPNPDMCAAGALDNRRYVADHGSKSSFWPVFFVTARNRSF